MKGLGQIWGLVRIGLEQSWLRSEGSIDYKREEQWLRLWVQSMRFTRLLRNPGTRPKHCSAENPRSVSSLETAGTSAPLCRRLSAIPGCLLPLLAVLAHDTLSESGGRADWGS